MRKTLWISSILIGLMVVPLAARSPQAWRTQGLELREQIQNINLVNGLYLTPEQARQLVPLARQNASLKQEMDRQIDQRQDPSLAVLQKMHQELLQSGQVSPPTAHQYHQLSGEIDRARADYLDRQSKLAGQARALLQENQLALVARAQLCLVPPDDARLPRVGQAGSTGHLEKVLERIRAMPDSEIAQKKKAALERLRPKLVKRFGPQGAEEKLAQIEGVVERAKRMSDEQFALQKSDLIRSLGLEHEEVRNNQEIDRLLAHHLLGPGSVAALERLASATRQ